MIDRLVQPPRRHRLRRQLPPGVPRAGGAGEAADGVAGQAQFARGLGLAAACGQQAVHVGVPGPGAAGDRPGPGALPAQAAAPPRMPGRRAALDPDCGGQVVAVAAAPRLHGLGEVVPQVPAVPRREAVAAGSGIARTSRMSVVRLTAAANRSDRPTPALPPSASATASSSAVTAGVRRACRLVSPITCPANVVFG
jgi:hypothetical protein